MWVHSAMVLECGVLGAVANVGEMTFAPTINVVASVRLPQALASGMGGDDVWQWLCLTA